MVELVRSVARVHNWRGKNMPGPFEHCGWCLDDGIVFVGWSNAGTDQMAPCPHCEVGFRLEFGRPESPASGPWDHDGYWRGKPTAGLERPEPHRPLTAEENRKRMKQLAIRIEEGTRGMPKPGVPKPWERS